MCLTFSVGRVVKATADSELVLVPPSSPASRSGLLFDNTRIDKNVPNHLALGNAYRFSMAGGEEMSEE